MYIKLAAGEWSVDTEFYPSCELVLRDISEDLLVSDSTPAFCSPSSLPGYCRVCANARDRVQRVNIWARFKGYFTSSR